MSLPDQKLWNIAVEVPLLKPLAYLSDPHQSLPLKRGLSVLVPLGGRNAKGVVLGPSHIPIDSQYTWKNVLSILSERPQLPEPYLQWVEWLASYYVYPIGQIFKMSFPSLKKGGRQSKSKPSFITPDSQSSTLTSTLTLTKTQSEVVEKISQQKGFQTHLLYGITGSGKTEVYFKLMEKIIQQQKQVLMLLPEISLTPQIVERFIKKFGQKTSVIHSDLTSREKTNQWWNIIDKKQFILIGARSAIFCPIEKLGLIIVDEEHEISFKQWDRLHYNARDAAIMLAKLHNCPVVLGSATPSLETWHNAQKGKYQMHTLPKRFGQANLPYVMIEDMTKSHAHSQASHLPFWLSQKLYDKMKEHLLRKNQVALFLNRRGDAQTVLCSHCGHCIMCPHCSVSLTVHYQTHLVCHYCNYHQNYEIKCDQCHEDAMQNIGIGTAGVEKVLKQLFPNKKILRADRDQIANRKDMELFINQVACRKADILVGTQMIAKGLDFKHLTLVGVVAADMSLNLPDFRAAERTFQLLVQMAGRAGRHKSYGEVVVQTFNCENPVIHDAIEHHYENFVQRELGVRQKLCYPPFYRIALIRAEGKSLKHVESSLHILAHFAKQYAQTHCKGDFDVLGPAPAPLSKLKGQYRCQILMKSSQNLWLPQLCQYMKTHQDMILNRASLMKSSVPPSSQSSKSPSQKTQQKVSIIFDIDPIQMV